MSYTNITRQSALCRPMCYGILCGSHRRLQSQWEKTRTWFRSTADPRSRDWIFCINGLMDRSWKTRKFFISQNQKLPQKVLFLILAVFESEKTEFFKLFSTSIVLQLKEFISMTTRRKFKSLPKTNASLCAYVSSNVGWPALGPTSRSFVLGSREKREYYDNSRYQWLIWYGGASQTSQPRAPQAFFFGITVGHSCIFAPWKCSHGGRWRWHSRVIFNLCNPPCLPTPGPFDPVFAGPSVVAFSLPLSPNCRPPPSNFPL